MVADDVLANPPPFDDILSVFVAEDWKHFQNDPAVLTRRCYDFYAGYGAAFRPRAILEIGVRRGYSAFALVRGAAEAGGEVQRFVGLDFEEDGPALIESAARLLGGIVPRVEILNVDTQVAFPTTLEGPFDLIHVDADHSTRGALSDLLNALPLLAPDGVIVADDYDYPPVAGGLEALLAVLKPGTRRLRIENYRGHMLIWPDGQRPDPAEVSARLPAWANTLIGIEDLAVAARQAPARGPFGLRVAAGLANQLLAALGAVLDLAAPPPLPLPLPIGVRPGLLALLDRAEAVARRIEAGPRAVACRAALDEVAGHIRYCRQLPDSSPAASRNLLNEFSRHAANFANSVAAPLLLPK